MKSKGLFTVTAGSELPTKLPPQPKMEVDLEEALDIAGAGRYQLFHCAIMASILGAAILEIIGAAFVLPAAVCDLDIPESLRGVITSLPNMGIILTATVWGRIADTFGRKPALIVSSAGAGLFGALAALMPNLASYVVCKFASSLFLSCPSSLCFAYAAELVPRKRRDLVLLILNALVMLASAASPALAWLVLPYSWRAQLGSMSLRPWRLLTAVYALPLLLCAAWVTQADESPKFLVTKGKNQKALAILRHIYEKNRMGTDIFPVTSFRSSADSEIVDDNSEQELTSSGRKHSAIDLLKPPHVKWLALTGFLMFGVFCSLNGLFLFVPDTINKVTSDSMEVEGTICVLMKQSDNQTSTATCTDDISTHTFFIMTVTTLIYFVIVMIVSFSPVSKKLLLMGTFLLTGGASLLSGVLRNKMAATIAMSALQMTALGIGPLTAYAVHLFPTALRGTAVGAVMMFGRVGSVAGANVAGLSLAAACSATFYGFSVLLLACAALSLALPKSEPHQETANETLSTTTASS